MATFDNQFNFRVDNQIKVISALRNGPVSLNDLAEKLNVSFTAIIKIVDQLIKEKVIVYTSNKTPSKKKGRKPSFVKINNKVGVTCAIDLSGDEVVFTINKLNSSVILQRSVPTPFFLDKKDLEDVCTAIKEALESPEVEGKPLLGICIGAPGMINVISGEFAASFKLQKLVNISISSYFFNKFNVPIDIYNDVKIGMVGERIFGSVPRNARNYLFAHIGRRCGCAFSSGGKIYQGSNGYSGEFSSYLNDDWFNQKHLNNCLEGLTDVSMRIEHDHPEIKLRRDQFVVDQPKFLKLFEENNPYVLKALDDNARRNAIQFIAYNDFLDLEFIVISGSITKLGDYYKNLLFKYIKEYDAKPFKTKFLFSSLENPTLFGAVYQANNLYFLRKFESIANLKSPRSKYDINEAFGDNI